MKNCLFLLFILFAYNNVYASFSVRKTVIESVADSVSFSKQDSLNKVTQVAADTLLLKQKTEASQKALKDSLMANADVFVITDDTVVAKIDTVAKTEKKKEVKQKSENSKKKNVKTKKPTALEVFKDSVNSIYQRIFVADSLVYDDSPIIYDMNLYRLFFTPVLYSEPVSKKMMSEWKFQSVQPKVRNMADLDSTAVNLTEVRDIAKDSLVNNLLYNLYLTDFSQNYVTEKQISKYESFEPVVIKDEEIKEKVFSLFKPENDYNSYKQMETKISISKPNFWKLQGNGSLQFSQNYISPNWYKGGESSNSILSYLMFNANYNDKQKIEFDNRIEAKVGFMTVPSDTIHKFNITSDLLRLTSKLGIKAFNRWYYTLYGEFNTQFFNNYKVNTNTRMSSFMSPANVIINVGLDYKLSLPKIELSTLYSPLTYNFRYVSDPLVDETQFGLVEGEKVLHTFGSTFQFNMRWVIIPQITWESRLNYFTNYHKIETEWENTFNFVLNRYLSAKLFVHARFFDMEAEHRVQWNELFSFGINYAW